MIQKLLSPKENHLYFKCRITDFSLINLLAGSVSSRFRNVCTSDWNSSPNGKASTVFLDVYSSNMIEYTLIPFIFVHCLMFSTKIYSLLKSTFNGYKNQLARLIKEHLFKFHDDCFPFGIHYVRDFGTLFTLYNIIMTMKL